MESYQKRFERRFWKKVRIDSADRCWPWVGAVIPDGYGMIGYKGTRILAHRGSWEMFFGPIPAGMCICHHCDNPPCVNPSHLFMGTVADNNSDKESKGRDVPLKGERNGRSKLNKHSVWVIRNYASSGVKRKELAEAFGVSKQVISSIVNKKSWKHI